MTDESIIPEEMLQGFRVELDNPEPPSIEVETLGHEVRHAIFSIAGDLTDCVQEKKKLSPIITYEEKIIYKSTLISQLVGNPHLSNESNPRTYIGKERILAWSNYNDDGTKSEGAVYHSPICY